MKLRLPKALMTAMAAAVVAATPLATTVATGTLAVAAMAQAAEHADVSGDTAYTAGDTYTLGGDANFTGIGQNGSAATIDGTDEHYNVTLTAAATNTMVENVPTLQNIGDLELAQGRYRVAAVGKLTGVNGEIDITGAQLWITGANYTGNNAITQNVTIQRSTFSENIGSLDYSALRVGGEMQIDGTLTVTGVNDAKIAFQDSHTLTLNGAMTGGTNLQIGSYSGTNYLDIAGGSASYTGVVGFNDFRQGNVTIRGGANGLHFGGLSGTGTNGGIGVMGGASATTLTLDVAEGGNYSFGGSIAAGVSLVKTGAGAQALTNTGSTLNGSLSVTGGSLTYDGVLQNTDNVSITNGATLSLGGAVTISQLIDNSAGNLILKEGVVIQGLSGGGKTVATGESLDYVGAASTSYTETIDLSSIATNTANVTVQGDIASAFSDVTFENGSTLVLTDGQTLSSAPVIDSVDSAITLEVAAGASATFRTFIASGNGISNVNVGEGATLNIADGGSDGAGRYNIFNRKSASSTLITLSSGATLNSGFGFFGWNNYDGSSTVSAPTANDITMESGSTWNITGGSMYLNKSVLTLKGGTINLSSSASIWFERQANSILTTEDAGQMSVIAGEGSVQLGNNGSGGATFNVARSTLFDIDDINTADLQISAKVTNNTYKLTKNGAGVLELTNSGNDFNKGVDVNAGTLKLGGRAGKAGTGAITVAAGATLELAHSVDCEVANNITLNGNLVVQDHRETLSGTISGTLQHVTLKDNSTLGLKGSNTAMTIGLSHLTMGENTGYFLTEGASLTLGSTASDADRVNKMEVYVGGDGTGKLRFNMLNNADWGSHKVIVLAEGTSVGGVYIDSGYLAMSSSANPNLAAEAASTDLQGHDLHMAHGANLVVTKNDGGDGNMGTIYLSGTTQVDSYGAVNNFVLNNDIVKEGTGTAILEKTNTGSLTLAGSVSIDQLKLTNGTLNVSGDLTLAGALNAERGTLNISGFNANIGGQLKVGSLSDPAYTSNVTISSDATINEIRMERGTLTFTGNSTVNGTLDLSTGGTSLGHIVVSGGTLTSNGTIRSRGADNYIELQGDGKLVHSNVEYSVLSGLAEGLNTHIYTLSNWTINRDNDQTAILNASVNILSTDPITLNAKLVNVDILNQAGGAMTLGGADKEIRNLLDYTGKAMTNSANLTVTGTLSISGTLTNTGTLTFDAANLVLDHGMSGFTSSDGSTPTYSGQDGNGYINAGSFIIIDSSSNADNLHINGSFASDSHITVTDGKVLYAVDDTNANTYYINNDALYSSVTMRNEGDLVWVNDNKTLTLDGDFDSRYRLATAFEGWVALGDGADVSNLGRTPADVDNIKVLANATASFTGAIDAIEPITFKLESGSTLNVAAADEGKGALDFGKLTLASGSNLSTARDISANVVASDGGKVTVASGATATIKSSSTVNLGLSGDGTIELRDAGSGNFFLTSTGNDFSGTLIVNADKHYILIGSDSADGATLFADDARPDLVLAGGNGTIGLVLRNSYRAGANDADVDGHSLKIGSLSSESELTTISGAYREGSAGHTYIDTNQSTTTTFAGRFTGTDARSTGIVMSGTGNLKLTNANESTGTLFINSGTVTLAGEKGKWSGDIKVAAGGTLAFEGDKVFETGRAVAFTGASTLQVTDGSTLTLKKNITDSSSATLAIGQNGKLIMGANSGWAGKYSGDGTTSIVIDKGADFVVDGTNTSTGMQAYTGVIEVASGALVLGNVRNDSTGHDTTMSTSNIIVRNGGSLYTNMGGNNKTFNRDLATEGGATLGNWDGHIAWSGAIRLNVAEGTTDFSDPAQIVYNEVGVTTVNMYWGKNYTWSGQVQGSGFVNFTNANKGDTYTLILSNNNNTFNGTYVVSGGTANNNVAELRVNGMTAARDAKIDLISKGKAVYLTIGSENPAQIAGLIGNVGTTVRAAGASRTLALNQADESTFAGVFANNGNNTISLTKTGEGNLILTGTNTTTGTLTVNEGTVTLGGLNGSWAGNVSLGADGTIAYSTGEKTLGGNGTFNDNSTIKVVDNGTLTLTRNIGSNVVLNVEEGSTLKLTGNGQANTSRFAGSGTVVFATGTRYINSTGNTFTGTLDVASGTVRIGATGTTRNQNADFNADTILVRNGATFETNCGTDTASVTSTGKTLGASIYTASGSTIKNIDGHLNIGTSGEDGTGIHLNVADLDDLANVSYDAEGTTNFVMHWAKHVVWDGKVSGDGILNVTGVEVDTGGTHRLVLNNNENDFRGTYKLNGSTATQAGNANQHHLMELYLNKDGAAQNATVELAGQAGTLVNLVVGTDNATIAGLKGTTGAVKADGGERTLTINQDADTEFAGAMTSTTDNGLNVVKSGSGELKLTSENTVKSLSVQDGGSVAVAGSGTVAAQKVALGADASVKLYQDAGGTEADATIQSRRGAAGSMQQLTLSSADITGATSGAGTVEDPLNVLGKMTSVDIRFAAANTASVISNITMQDVTITNGAVTFGDNVTAIAASATEVPVSSGAMGRAAVDLTPALTATTVKSGGSVSGTLTVDVSTALLGQKLAWTILDGVTLAEDGFTLALGDVLTRSVNSPLPAVWLSVAPSGTDMATVDPIRITADNIGNITTATGGLLAGYVGQEVNLVLSIPEPTSGALSVLALAALAARRRRKSGAQH